MDNQQKGAPCTSCSHPQPQPISNPPTSLPAHAPLPLLQLNGTWPQQWEVPQGQKLNAHPMAAQTRPSRSYAGCQTITPLDYRSSRAYYSCPSFTVQNSTHHRSVQQATAHVKTSSSITQHQQSTARTAVHPMPTSNHHGFCSDLQASHVTWCTNTQLSQSACAGLQAAAQCRI